ncbi:MAG TPA: serine/threonine-protein kinase [Actinocrinis sp.]|nr:serine/threonine-protein kinase [Actinocrinis sp.]
MEIVRTGIPAPRQAYDPERIGRYQVLGRIGSGAMGQVYLARSPGSRLVAVKTIHTELADDGDFRRRFAREVTAARSVGGAYTAPVVDADPDADVPWLATLYLPVPTMAVMVERCGPLPVPAVRWLAAGCAEALESIHRAGLIHRDLKPGNVLVAADGPRVIDFGLVRAEGQSNLTIAGDAMGTPSFMAPEQASGEGPIGPAVDVFSLGATLMFALTGTSPYRGRNINEAIFQMMRGTPDLSVIPEEMRPVLAACLRRDPDERPTPAQLVDYFAPHVAGSHMSPPLPTSALRLIQEYGRKLTEELGVPTPEEGQSAAGSNGSAGSGPGSGSGADSGSGSDREAVFGVSAGAADKPLFPRPDPVHAETEPLRTGDRSTGPGRSSGRDPEPGWISSRATGSDPVTGPGSEGADESDWERALDRFLENGPAHPAEPVKKRQFDDSTPLPGPSGPEVRRRWAKEPDREFDLGAAKDRARGLTTAEDDDEKAKPGKAAKTERPENRRRKQKLQSTNHRRRNSLRATLAVVLAAGAAGGLGYSLHSNSTTQITQAAATDTTQTDFGCGTPPPGMPGPPVGAYWKVGASFFAIAPPGGSQTTSFNLIGCGFKPGQVLTLAIVGGRSIPDAVTADSVGRFNYTVNANHEFFPGDIPAGAYVIEAEYGSVVASVHFTVG